MKPHKIKFNETTGKPQKSFGHEGQYFRIQAVYYSGTNPSAHLNIFDKDGDPIIYPISGQLIAKVVPLDNVSIQLPLIIQDEEMHNEVIIYGETYRQ